MNGPEVVDVEVSIGIPRARNALGVFLHHPDADKKVEAESVAWTCGAQFTTYPEGPVPDEGSGYVEIRGEALYVSIGRMYIISPLLMKGEEVTDLEKAVVYFTDAPFDPADTSEHTWMAVHLPLFHSEKEN